MRQGKKALLFEKRSKDFCEFWCALPRLTRAMCKSFLVLFFKKELLAFLLLPGAALAGTHLTLHVGEGRLLRLNSDARNVMVGDAAVADVQVAGPRVLYIYGRRPGETSLTAIDGNSGVAAALELDVTRNPQPAQATLPAGSALSVTFDNNRLVVGGAVPDLGAALSANGTARAFNPGSLPPLDRTQLPGAQQITLRVRIAEVSRSVQDQLGINFNVAANPGSFTFNLVTGSFLGSAIGSLGGAAPATNFGDVSAGVSAHKVNGNVLLNALQSEGLLNDLAEPNLTTISGETAHFAAGGEVPIPVPQALGVTTIEYKPYGVKLDFTPTLLPNDRIALHVHPSVSEISATSGVTIANNAVPSFIERDAETSVEMASGQTLAIAGLFQRNEANSISKFPGLGDLPVLGALFRSTLYQRNETELVILVTPLLSEPQSNPRAFPLPGDQVGGVAPPAASIPSGFVAN
jgi:pilus assembly protein CpaC